ncbi:HAD family hydrolase [Allokutzneria albata]|uniref:Beta-phosphoglucomutase n=1 Tax=Allokutzneria albata TaxID=211114 RepID=A0A1G9RWB2_ALLAB|nr:beta-phosphoglucomutase family hydrolase [Allokutzneria albata]SDM27513.1 haloacid dehalogenase superfamily, subfamily IA, variant 3 with third motif having DD or ED/beta-phosphoglucomutase family hydrolase [Allokutzneria albata]
MPTKLPDKIAACLFDMDGVLTSTAELHRKAWKQVFDEFLAVHEGPSFRPFSEQDYLDYVDGRPRRDGVRAFLASRGITLPEGSPADPHDLATVHAVGNRKNDLIDKILTGEGVSPYPGSVRFVKAAHEAGLALGVVTSSANGERVLAATGLAPLISVRVDGVVIEREQLRGKPAPDSFLAAARELGVHPGATAVFEDALSGVAAGRAGEFGLVVGVDRAGQAEALRQHGADIVVDDLGELL